MAAPDRRANLWWRDVCLAPARIAKVDLRTINSNLEDNEQSRTNVRLSTRSVHVAHQGSEINPGVFGNADARDRYED
jgi:hypothetical protein